MSRTCPDCHNVYDDEILHCPEDGINLSALPIEDELIGRSVGSYRIVKPLGKGGMGAVYMAEHPVIGSKVAIKFLHPQYATDTKIVDRFFNEARAVNVIGHDNILKILDLNVTEDNRHYFVMEFLQGRALQNLLKHNLAMPLEVAGPILLQCCDALEAAHQKNIIHRDLKPDNIYLISMKGRKNFVKIVDFGIAKLSDASGQSTGRTQTGMVMGTPAYMSPEQAGGKTSAIDARSDVYSLGVMMFQLATGKLPFPGQSFAEVLVGHLQTPPPRPRDLCPQIPEQYEAVILKTLQKSQDDRYASMGELKEAIFSCMQALGITADLPLDDLTDPELAPLDSKMLPSSPGPRTPSQPGRSTSPRAKSQPGRSSQPGRTASQPGRTASQPGRGPSQPGRPGVRTSQPGVRTSQPGVRTSQPGVRTSQPGVRTSQPRVATGRTAPGEPQAEPPHKSRVPLYAGLAVAVLLVLGVVAVVLKNASERAEETARAAAQKLLKEQDAKRASLASVSKGEDEAPVPLSVVSDPLDTEIVATWHGGERRGTTPLMIEVPRNAKVHFEYKKPGFTGYASEVIADQAQTVTARLRPDPAATALAPPEANRKKRHEKDEKKDAVPAAKDGLIDLGDALK